MRKRVVVTGMGVVASSGFGRELFWDAVKTGRSGVRPIAHFDPAGFRTRIGACIDRSSFPEPSLKTEPRLWDVASQIAFFALQETISDARIDRLADVGLILGSACGGLLSLDQQFENFYVKGRRFVMPYTIPRTMLNAASSLLAIEFGLHGPNCTVSTACSSSSHAIGWAFQMVSHGMLEVCLAGGTDCPISPWHLQAWDQLRALASENERPGRACRPFSRNRAGLVLGEGAAILALEERDRARVRGAHIYGELLGYGSNCDAEGMLQPDGESQAECIRKALSDTGRPGLLPDYISAHATGTSEGDRQETLAVKRCFSERAYRIPISAVKSTLGHTLGASGALATVATLCAMRDGVLPPTMNLEEPDPECDLDYVPDRPREHPVSVALVHSFAFGGSNAVLVLSRGDKSS